ncbi:hypothetical protein L6452_06631 [Arctium lappa]|uniref:Uncharacterized protein n=1 Tax=Arctium lappa TaxID=4217 RepID=A0ACB9EKD8_ARCLA|nr:hypothetical protein L6452_06631 [Arctium lappa]
MRSTVLQPCTSSKGTLDVPAACYSGISPPASCTRHSPVDYEGLIFSVRHPRSCSLCRRLPVYRRSPLLFGASAFTSAKSSARLCYSVTLLLSSSYSSY